jgi:hypothetical protein
MSNLPQTPRRVNPHVTVIRDSQVYRWLRHDGRTIRTSNTGWTDAAAAVTAAQSIADCYGVAFRAPRTGGWDTVATHG